MRDLLLPSTDAGVFAQLVLTLLVGTPAAFVLYKRRAIELVWFVGGLEFLLLALYAYRTVH